MSNISRIIEQQIQLFQSLGITIELCGSRKVNEYNQYSDIDFRCFCQSPEINCQKAQKYYNYLYPYKKYKNATNNNEIICNFKFFVDNYQCDLTFFPLNYRYIYTEIENYRNHLSKSRITFLYLYKKTLINQLIYETSNLSDRKIYMGILKKTKVNYFNYCIEKYCREKNINSDLIRKYIDLNFEGSYIGILKIK